MPPTPRQTDAITAPLGPVLVLAGPGAGKTYCLIGRVAHLIDGHQARPGRICTVTFTNKAAEEVAGRLRAELGGVAAEVTRGTLHGLCVDVLREHGAVLGLKPGFGIADEPYQQAVLGRLGVWPAKRRPFLLRLFGRHRLEGRELTGGDARLFGRYVAYLRERDMLDFDDLIARTAELLEAHETVAAAVAGRWDHVLVDEFQDLDAAQYAVLRALTRGHRSVFAVGDDEQSIFSWRGADARILKRFVAEFGVDRPIVLDENRRCSRQIFAVARRLVEANDALFAKELRATRESAHEVAAVLLADETREAAWIADDILADRQASGRAWGDYGVLYRTHDVGLPIERELIRRGVPCRLAPRRALLDDTLVGGVTASLRLARSPGDPAALDALAGEVLPASLLEELRSEAKRSGTDVLTAARAVGQRRGSSDPDGRRAWRFVFRSENIAALARSETTLRDLVVALVQQGVGKYRNVLEERADDLTDPAAVPQAVALAERLRRGTAADGRVWLDRCGGMEIGLRGLLQSVGITGAGYLDPSAPAEPGDVVIALSDAGPMGLALTVFKALQLLHTPERDTAFRSCVTFDLETTDRDPAHCEIVEIAAVRVRDGLPAGEFHSLVRPVGPVSAAAREVHGYGDAELAAAPPFADVWRDFLAFVGDDVLVAHNAQQFDIPVLRRAAEPLDGFDRLAFYDTLPLARALVQGGAGLVSLAGRFGLEGGRAHHALDDARTLAAVLLELQRLRTARGRTAALTNRLDYLGLALALDGGPATEETRLLRDIAGAYALGRFSDALEYYEGETTRRPELGAPGLDDVIARLGGRGRMERLRAEPDPRQRHPASIARLETLLEAAEAASLEEGIDRFLERVALSRSDGFDVAPDRVSLLTMHATKGLEFSRVYVAGVEDGQLLRGPQEEHVRREIEEARRLLYVAMTRAEDRLVLTRARRRNGVTTGGSRFLDEMGLAAADLEPSPPDPADSTSDLA